MEGYYKSLMAAIPTDMQKTTTLFTGISKNILYRTRDPSSDIIIADFGIAKHLDSSDNQLTSFTGSFEYVAPEILTHKGHGKPMDMWSIRIITYIILCDTATAAVAITSTSTTMATADAQGYEPSS
ncbi:hypothetical protein BJV74DRAFT_891863 [Russula compacta]|nr:hypothetical protein BJV74DRAFT_891863 [Russula compacta]